MLEVPFEIVSALLFSLLGCIAILMAPIPFVLRAYGHHLRKNSKYSPTGHLPKHPPSDEEKKQQIKKVRCLSLPSRAPSLTYSAPWNS